MLCMMNGAMPRLSTLPMTRRSGRIFLRRMRMPLLALSRKRRIQIALMACERIVASAAPETPMPKTKMKTGSSTMFTPAPSSTLSIAVVALPCALMKVFSPSASCTNTVPIR